MISLIDDRTCGPCFECCIHTGVDAKASDGRIALRTYPGKPCLHLLPDRPGKACAVYPQRPHACERYKCVWLQGMLSDEDLRPDISGVILGFYDANNIGKPTSATITICDVVKSGPLGDISNPLGRILSYATNQVNDVKVVNYKTREVVFLKDGLIYAGKLVSKPSNPESLEFNFDIGKPIGKYLLQEINSPA